ncbi:unnamed protein product [Rotaria socialis]|uniref:Uncharacterized protein n=1 Tax=Rotaria socialis TaxID=392032 RepID=A0A820B317_9BILA|nr:unnamed protein product [Rotaria socialis]CAF4201047.1 unnamed protein product [Rotaria socialis]
MTTSNFNTNPLNMMTNQPNRKSTDLLAKIRPIKLKKPDLVQPLSRPNTIQISSGFKIPNTRIQSNDSPSYEPLVTISDNDETDGEDFISPIQKLTKEELREELNAFQSATTNTSTHALLANDNDDDTESLIDIIKHEQGHFDAECILFIDLSCRNLTDANSLSVCRNLIILNLNNNSLTNVRGFGTLIQLKNLSLAENRISSLDGLQSCESLETLNVAGNNLTGLKSLAPLLNLTQLRSLCLTDRQNNLTNPLCDFPSYQNDVKNNLPNLDTLDNEWLGQGFQEHLTSLESAIEQLETSYNISKSKTNEKPTIIITKAASFDRSVHLANEEYEELFQTIQMLVK